MMRTATHPAAAILYVDDEELACKYFERAMADDYEVLTAGGVDQAMAILATPGHGIGVLVTDYRMPGRVGSILLRYVNQHFPHMVCLLVTAYADKDVLLDSINGAEVFRVLEKPLDLHQLRLTMRLASERARERLARRDNLLAIEETLAFLAHELNTPLATIGNFARGIARRASGADPAQQLEEIGHAATLVQDNARYCLSVLSSFVDSVKLANGSLAPAAPRSDHSAAQLLSTLLDAYPLTAAQRQMIRTDVQQDFMVKALPNCVALVLSSIMSNALRALDQQADAALRFTVLVDDAPRISISDNGPGIPPEILARLLVDPVTTHAHNGGNGWGLIFCQRIMQSFGGNIVVQSKPGRYTTVTLNFPAIEKELV